MKEHKLYLFLKTLNIGQSTVSNINNNEWSMNLGVVYLKKKIYLKEIVKVELTKLKF